MSSYFNSIHPDLQVKHDDVCTIVNDYLHYIAVVKGHSLQTTFNYYIDLKDFFAFMLISRGLTDADHPERYNQINIDISFIKTITTTDIYEFLYMLQRKKNCKATTRNRKLSALRGFFKYLTQGLGVLDVDPAIKVDSAKNAKVLPKYLSQEEAVSLLNNIQSDFYSRDYCMITLFLNCGMRLAELVKINLSSIKEDTIHLQGKGNKERLAYLTPACIDALTHYLKERATLKNIPDSDKDTLFVSKRTGKRLSPRRVEQIVERSLQSAGLAGKGFSPHKLRHTAATLMYQTGSVDILELKELLGHANVATTQIYTHLNKNSLRKAVNASPLSNLKYVPDNSASESEDNGNSE
ncbi:MAG: tyrosine-type recombinase/integrase [Faecalibacterium sp.]